MFEHLKKIFNKKELEEELIKKQEEISEQYAKEGPTQDVLDKQVALNQLRNELNISDSTKRIYKNFVQ